MLYYIFEFLDKTYDFPGAGVFRYISFRAAMALITSLVISMLFGKNIITFLKKKQVEENIRALGLVGEKQKEGTPTMGGLIILAAIIFPVLFFAKLHNIYIILMLVTTVWLGFIGFLDDYIKIFKKDKKGLAGKFKILGQVALGLVIGFVFYFHEDVVIKEKISSPHFNTLSMSDSPEETGKNSFVPVYADAGTKSLKTTIPFLKNNEFNYEILIAWLCDDCRKWGWLIFIPIVIFIITAVSNGANVTDGVDGLATGTSAIVGITLAAFAYVSGNIIFADYLNILYIPYTGELVVFASALIGACTGFLWYNAYPAQVFMGDTGSLALGGIIAVFAIAVRKELLIPIMCGVFLIENLSVIIQVAYFKYTKKKYGEGKRIFKMSPLHHHYQKAGMHESKIASRFWIVGIMLAVFTIITLKLM